MKYLHSAFIALFEKKGRLLKETFYQMSFHFLMKSAFVVGVTNNIMTGQDIPHQVSGTKKDRVKSSWLVYLIVNGSITRVK